LKRFIPLGIRVIMIGLFAIVLTIPIACSSHPKDQKKSAHKKHTHKDGNDKHVHSSPNSETAKYVCPMGCEKDKTYSTPGKCPVCKMNLVKSQVGAHSDHDPKHGGQFFMAPDKFHHLEGVMANPREFRLYFYNNFNKPILAKPFVSSTKVEAEKVDKEGREMGNARKLAVEIGKEGKYLSASIPKDLLLPLYFTVWIQFQDREEPDLFNFTFKKK